MGYIIGEVTEGMEKAQEFLSIDEYQDRIEDITGFRPFPGTLNLRTEPEAVKKLKEEAPKERIEPFMKDGKELGGLTVYSTTLRDTDVAVLDIDRSDHGDEVLEVIAADKLRDRFDLEDGEELKVRW